jgi:hypothetical protein
MLLALLSIACRNDLPVDQTSAPDWMGPTSATVDGTACSYSADALGGDAGLLVFEQ